jgi:hypothetical protein
MLPSLGSVSDRKRERSRFSAAAAITPSVPPLALLVLLLLVLPLLLAGAWFLSAPNQDTLSASSVELPLI